MNILEQIVEHKMNEVAQLRRDYSAADFRSMEYFSQPTRSLRNSLLAHKPFAIIAELKRSSPSGGMLNASVLPDALASEYERHGASAISVLTDGKFFSGSVNDVSCVRKTVSLPLLRKDFIIDYLQVYEAKAYGADAILLIAAILEKNRLDELHKLAVELGLECLVEVYERRELDKIDFDAMKLIGINNRDLRTMAIDVNHSIELSKVIPAGITVVSESGIHTSSDIKSLIDAKIRAALIGEYFMKSTQPGIALRNLLESAND
ncbi:MAG: indole-3-glycerol phosphate synthase TrpC [Bacteroidetes bacterium]|nr:MAG: indole-3-glycerol phosphate synthase TrpC [Bacteroidota bacterium]